MLEITNGVLSATAVAEGRKAFTLAVSSDNAGGGTFNLGSFTASEEGRGKAAITASDASSELKLDHDDYGVGKGFTIAYTAGGTDGSASLGLSAATYKGIDVAGTIGGQGATGAGRTLTGDADTSAEGLLIKYTGTATGSVGSMTFSRGVASAMELVSNVLLDTDAGSIQGIVDALDTQKQGIDNRIEAFEDRLDLRAESLIKRFTALEVAMAKAQQEMGWLQAQLGALPSMSAGR